MKKIAKTFYVSEFMFNGIKSDNYMSVKDSLNVKPSTGYLIPIEITFSVPEKKIEITESQFDSVVLGPWREFLVHNETHRTMVNQMKQKLFGDTHD